jgi:hypothetical protein
MMQKAKRALNECLKHTEDMEREQQAPAMIASLTKFKLEVLNMLAMIEAEPETVVKCPQVSRAQ